MKKWKCTVCGYIHEGEEPPEICPVCGADKSKFIELTDEPENKPSKPSGKSASPEPEIREKTTPRQETATEKIMSLMITHHAHPITAHIPNGVVPVSIVFLAIAVVLNFSNLGLAAFYNLVFVLITLPAVLFSGYNAWQRKYGGNLTSLFITKIVSACIVFLSALTAVIWAIFDPGLKDASSDNTWAYLLLNLIMLAAAVVAGYIGGKLVFKD